MFKCYQFVGFQFTSFSIKPVIENRINGLQIFGKEEQKEREEKWERRREVPPYHGILVSSEIRNLTNKEAVLVQWF